MRKFNLYIAFLAVFAMTFTSCSKEDEEIENSEKATISFEAVVNDLLAKQSANKQALGDLPACSDDTPAYVRIVLRQGQNDVVGTSQNPHRINLVAGRSYTVDDPALELEPGSYTLDHFTVYNQNDQVIWIAPRLGSELASFVDTNLPQTFNLGAGVKKYINVDVLCFDDREVNEYGYLFFEIETVEAIEFCFFANYCDDNGRHFTANYSVDVWLGTDASGTPLYTDLSPETGTNDDGDFFARPLCIALPGNDNPNEDYIYYELTLLDWGGNYGDVAQRVVSGTLNRNDIEANFGTNQDVNYEHVRFNCPPSGDPTGPQCLPNPTGDCERFVFEQDVDIADFPAGQNPTYPVFSDDGDEVGTITFNLERTATSRDLLTANVALNEGWTGTSARITLPEYVNADDVCVRNFNSANYEVVYQAGSINYPVVVRFATIICP